MQLGFIAYNDLEGIEADCRFAVEHGFAGLEFNHWGSFKDLTEETVRSMRDILDRHGVACSTLGLWGWNHISADPAQRAESLALLDRAVSFARILGAPTLITGGGSLEGAGLAENAAELAKVLRPRVDCAAEQGTRIALYGFHGGSFLSGIEGYEAVWEHLPEVGIKYDPANIDHAGQDYLAIARRYGDRIFHVHIKEHLMHDGELASQPAAGMGDIAFGKVLAFLYEHDYRGYLTIEPHGPIWSREPHRSRMLRLSKRYLSQFLL